MSAPAIQVRPIIGLEVHVQLSTRTKMFCRCPLEFGAAPNTRVCPTCLGLPGALPVMNRRAFEHAVRVGLALNCRIAPFTKWDRKSYYYPDMPKNYQISQYDLPLSSAGYFDLPARDGGAPARIRIIRAHLEEDAGKNVHDLPGCTGVDLNRAGTPLLEIVTEPDMVSAEQAYAFATELQELVRYLGASEASMQKGQMRFEPNVNLSIVEDGTEYRTPIAEIKNLNSFRAVRDATDYELQRQLAEWQRDHDYVLEKVGKINCGWRDDAGVTEIQRSKEEAHDYRYFPDPDLVPVTVEEGWLASVRNEMPELPPARKARLQRECGMNAEDAATLVSDRATADVFERALGQGANPVVLGKQFLGFWSMHANAGSKSIAELGIEPERFAELSRITAEGKINATAAQKIAAILLTDGRSPAEIAAAEGFEQLQDAGEIEDFVDRAIAANTKAVADYRSGGKKSAKALGFLQGQVMRSSSGSAPPQVVRELLEKKLANRLPI